MLHILFTLKTSNTRRSR